MLPSRRALLLQATELGFEPASLEKVLRLGEMLAAVGAHPRLSDTLVLKGGTALNLFFGRPTRLSVDLDFNFVGRLDKAAMEEERPHVEAALEALAAAHAYALQRSGERFAGRTLHLAYRRAADGLPDSIQLDVNYLHRQCLLPPTRRTMWQPGATSGDEVTYPVLHFDELAAGKLLALLDRAAARDAWDAARLPSFAGVAWPTERSRAIFIALSGILPHPLDSYASRGLRRLSEEHLEDLLYPLLLREERPSAAHVLERAWSVVEPMLDLTEPEQEYVDRLQVGELRPELLFPDEPDLATRAARCPPLQWKALNARQHRGGRGAAASRARVRR